MNAQCCRPSDAAREGTITTVKVGPDATEFKVNMALLVRYSHYFERSLNGPWAEAETGIIRLADVDSYTFEMFVNWTYTQTLPAYHAIKPVHCDCHNDVNKISACLDKTCDMRWTKAYCFGDRFQSTGFKNAVYARYVEDLVAYGGSPFFAVINYAFANLPSEDIFLKILVDTHCLRYTPDVEEDEELTDRDHLPNALLVRMMHRYSTVITLGIAKKKLKVEDYRLEDAVADDQV